MRFFVRRRKQCKPVYHVGVCSRCHEVSIALDKHGRCGVCQAEVQLALFN